LAGELWVVKPPSSSSSRVLASQVTVLEMLEDGEHMSATYRPFFPARLKKAGIKMITGARVEEISEGVRVS
jgi:hypothetical protein